MSENQTYLYQFPQNFFQLKNKKKRKHPSDDFLCVGLSLRIVVLIKQAMINCYGQSAKEGGVFLIVNLKFITVSP